MKDALSWDEGNQLLQSVGGMRWFVDRLQALMDERGWSQSALAKKMTDAGYPMHQSVVSRILGEQRRQVTIDELIGFSKVFGIPVGELLLPPTTIEHIKGLRDLAQGPDAVKRLHAARHDLDELVGKVVDRMLSDADTVAYVLDGLQAERRYHQEDEPLPSDVNPENPSGLRSDLDTSLLEFLELVEAEYNRRKEDHV